MRKKRKKFYWSICFHILQGENERALLLTLSLWLYCYELYTWRCTATERNLIGCFIPINRRFLSYRCINLSSKGVHSIQLIEIYLKPALVLLESVTGRIVTAFPVEKPCSEAYWLISPRWVHRFKLKRYLFDRTHRDLPGTSVGFVGIGHWANYERFSGKKRCSGHCGPISQRWVH